MKALKNQYVKIKNSKIHGSGGFAKKNIKKGTKIIEYIGNVLTKADAEKVSDKDGIYLFILNNKYDIDGNVSWNPAKNINHSCNPNCKTDVIKNKIWIIAKKDIKKGEELSYDYGFSLDTYKDYPCKCGAKNCIGYIVDREHWKKIKKPRVLVAMSGGVDSSVAALLMKQQGYEVIGAFMKNWSDSKNDLGECTWRGERRIAQKIAATLNIPLKTLDFEKEYRKLVVEDMYKKYRQGITPNPDIDCNEKVKFPLLIKAAKKLKCKFLVTGHYARIKKEKNKFKLLRAKDELKDQSYFLYRLKQGELAKTLFPIGELTKIEVREIAKKNKFPNFDKKSTVGICFIGKVNLKKFLQKKIPQKPGKILDPDGNQIGTHDGIYYYTIGQRIGPRFGIEVEKRTIESMKKWYVAKKDAKTNTIISAPEGHELNFKKEIYIKNVYWINQTPKTNEKVLTRIRQVGELLPSKLTKSKNIFKVTLNKSITGVSEGQAIVLYKGKECIGGGVISFS